MKVPFLDLRCQNKGLKNDFLKSVEAIINSNAFILGKEVGVFEEDFAKFCNTKYAIGVSNGCDALYWSLKALNIGPRDEVITVANTFAATVLAIVEAGATPVLVDCKADNYNIDIDAIEAVITSKTKAIMPVHLYGQAVSMEPLIQLSEKYNLKIIEDAAQAHGSDDTQGRCGSLGDMAGFSFFPGKNLGALGDAGAITTNSDELYEKVLTLRNYGQKEKYNHSEIGWNFRMDTIQAAFLIFKLKELEDWNNQRRNIAKQYLELLKETPLVLPEVKDFNAHVFHLFVVQTEKRNELIQHLNDNEITPGIHYPIPIHLSKCFSKLGYNQGDFPVTEHLASRILSLPIYPGMTEEQVQFVADTIIHFYE